MRRAPGLQLNTLELGLRGDKDVVIDHGQVQRLLVVVLSYYRMTLL